MPPSAVVDISSVRTSELLSAFLTEIGASKPVDQHFTKNQTFDYFWKKKKVKNGGKQVTYPVNTGENDTVGWRTKSSVISLAEQDTARLVTYANAALSGSIVIFKDDLSDNKGDAHKIFDLVDHRRSNVLDTMAKTLNSAMYAESPSSLEPESLHTIVKASGSVGELNPSTYTDWKSTVTTGVGSWASNGMDDLRTLRTTLIENKAKPDVIFTSAANYNAYEANIDVDARYTNDIEGKGGRGFTSLTYALMPIIFDGDCASDDLYMIDSDTIHLEVMDDAKMEPEAFMKSQDQFSQSSLVDMRFRLVCTSRRSNAKLEGITTP